MHDERGQHHDVTRQGHGERLQVKSRAIHAVRVEDHWTATVVGHWTATGDGRPPADLQLQMASLGRRDHVARQEHGDRLEVESLAAHEAARGGV